MQTPRQIIRARFLLEAGAFLSLALLVATSAAMTKQAVHAPPLAAIEPAHVDNAPLVSLVAATAETEATPTTEINETAPGLLDDERIRFYNGRAIRPARIVNLTVTAYSPDHRSCGDFADGVTASNMSIWTNGMKLIAADTSIFPFGSMLSVPGYDGGAITPVLDRGGAIKGDRLDVLFPTHEAARRWGVQDLAVTVWEFVDEG